MKKYQIICVDDDEQFLQSLEGSIPKKVQALCPDFQCVFEFVASAEELFQILAHSPQDVPLAMVLSDQMMAGTSGIDLIEKLKANHPHIVSMLLTGYERLDSVKYAVNRHLLDQYVSKPIEDIHAFVSLIATLLKSHHSGLEERERTEQLVKTILQLRISNEEISAMQAAAEGAVELSESLKGLDLEKVVAVAMQEVPKIFGAERAALCFAPNGCPTRLISQGKCSCPQEELLSRIDVQTAIKDSQAFCGPVPDICAKHSGQSPEVIVPLSIGVFEDNSVTTRDWQGYLCMFNINESCQSKTHLMKYKARLVSEILGASLTYATLYERAKRDSQTDLLTGIGTRRVLAEQLQAEYDRAVRYKHTFCVVVVDVDRFKKVNDEFGHIVGDEALQQLADILRQEIRKTDILTRYGGDEFVILMPEIGLDDAVNAAERMRSKAESTLTFSGQTVTISCGVAEWSGAETESGTDLLRRADTALYKAKNAGRNNVQVEKAA